MSIAPLIPLARREGNSKKPVYQMHKWWARRLGVNFRFLLLGAMSRSGVHEKTIWRQFYQPDTKLDITVLDPFMGGGTSIVEATKLGARTIGVDIDPMAWFIVNKQIGEVDEAAFREDWEAVQRDISERIRSYYYTQVNGKLATVVYYFWVEVIPCESCGHEFEGHIHFLLYSKKTNNGTGPSRLGFCHSCHKLHELRSDEKYIDCICGERTEVEKGNLLRGGKYICPNCHHEARISDLSPELLPLRHRLFAIEYIDPDTGERAYKKADAADQQLYEKANKDLTHLWDKLPIPKQSIPIEGRSDLRPVSLGYKKYHELFNRRQLLCLALILRRINGVTNSTHRELLLLAFSDSLACNNWFCSYAFGYRKLTPLFGLHAFRRIARPVEGNVWGTTIGRGSFTSSVEKVLRGKRFSAKPFEYIYEKERPRRIEARNPAQATIVSDVNNLVRASGQTAHLAIADSRDLSWLPERSVDLVLTDPPYYDNLAYSEMADFYFVWLKDHVKWSIKQTSQHSPISDSLFVRTTAEEEHRHYTEGLTNVFSGCRKALKNEGIMVFTYHHVKRKAWESLTMALRHADFRVTSCFPILAEGKSGFHSDQGNLKWDIVFVCRPGAKENALDYRPGPAKRWLASRLTKLGLEAGSGDGNFGGADRKSLAFGLTVSYLTNCNVSDEKIREILETLEKTSISGGYEQT